MLICPSKHYCPLGSFRPIPCAHSSICPSNSQSQIQMAGLIAIVVIDAVLLLWKYGPLLRKIYRRRWRKELPGPSSLEKAVRKTPFGSGKAALTEPDSLLDGVQALEDSAVKFDGGQLLDSDFECFIQSLENAIGTREFGLSFSFTDLGLKLPDSRRDILKGLSGCIGSGSMWGVLGASGAGKCKATWCIALEFTVDVAKPHFWISSWAKPSPPQGIFGLMASKKEFPSKWNQSFHGVWCSSFHEGFR